MADIQGLHIVQRHATSSPSSILLREVSKCWLSYFNQQLAISSVSCLMRSFPSSPFPNCKKIVAGRWVFFISFCSKFLKEKSAIAVLLDIQITKSVKILNFPGDDLFHITFFLYKAKNKEDLIQLKESRHYCKIKPPNINITFATNTCPFRGCSHCGSFWNKQLLQPGPTEGFEFDIFDRQPKQ